LREKPRRVKGKQFSRVLKQNAKGLLEENRP
jgi:hypothetical protein